MSNDPQNDTKLGFATNAVHAGTTRAIGDPVGTPIFPVIAWEFDDLEHARHVFATNEGRSYSRIQNPTTEVLETRLAALEGSAGAIATTTGQASRGSCRRHRQSVRRQRRIVQQRLSQFWHHRQFGRQRPGSDPGRDQTEHPSDLG
jgi:cystathionine beta-lyase/cystathionine gamma-synthase